MHNQMLMIDDNTSDELLLHDDDFPPNYKNMAHPLDYLPVGDYTKPNMHFNKKSHHNRLIFRIYWAIGSDLFVPLSFVCDTGAPMYFYLSPKAKHVLYQRILTDDIQQEYAIINNKKVSISDTPQNHLPSNIIGLLMLAHLGLKINADSFSFDNCPDYF